MSGLEGHSVLVNSSYYNGPSSCNGEADMLASADLHKRTQPAGAITHKHPGKYVNSVFPAGGEFSLYSRNN